jgi:prophage antirepressor-like protein
MSAIVPFEFEGVRAHVYVFRGRPCMLAPEAGAALGYTAGGFRKCLDDWQKQGEVTQPKHFEVLRGKELEEFRTLAGASVESTLPAKATQTTVIYEAGLHMVCLLTKRPLGRKLRHLLSDEVLPKLSRGEAIPGAKPPPVIEIVSDQPAAPPGLDAYREGAALLDQAVEAELLGKREALVRKIKLFRGESGVDLFAAPEETFEPLPSALAKVVTALAPGESIEANLNGHTTLHYAPIIIPEGYLSASNIAPKFPGATAEDVRDVARALGLWQREPEWGVFDGIDHRTGKPKAGQGGFYLSPAAQEAMRPSLERVAALKPERLSYARALERAAELGSLAFDELRAAEGDELRRVVRELTKPAKKSAAG